MTDDHIVERLPITFLRAQMGFAEAPLTARYVALPSEIGEPTTPEDSDG